VVIDVADDDLDDARDGDGEEGTDQPEEFGVPDELFFEYRESVPAIDPRLGALGGVERMMAQDMLGYLSNDILAKVDRAPITGAERTNFFSSSSLSNQA